MNYNLKTEWLRENLKLTKVSQHTKTFSKATQRINILHEKHLDELPEKNTDANDNIHPENHKELLIFSVQKQLASEPHFIW